MRQVARMTGLLALILFVTPVGFAQEAFIGMWKGEATDDDGQVYPFSFEVISANSPAVAGESGNPSGGEFSDFEMDGDAITFVLQVDERFDCRVEPKEDGSYIGFCENLEGQTAEMVLKRMETTGKD